MSDVGIDIILLADRLAGGDEVRTTRALVERLDRLGHTSRVICRSAAVDHGIGDLAECPGLGGRWQLPWASRGLRLGDRPGRPRVLHVLSASMADAGLEVAERWQLPYLLSVDEFPRRSGRLRLSRSWCRGLVATNRELADALIREFQVPARAIRTIARGIPAPVASPPAGKGRVPVVGAAGPMVAGSGFATFLNAARKVVDAGIDAEFLIAGQGDDEADLRRRADRLRIADRLTIADEYTVGRTFWDALDVFCQTSVIPTAGRPLSLAMSHGVPSIAAEVEGLRTIIRDGEDGLRVPRGDAGALAGAVLAMLSDPARAARLGEAGRDAVLRDHHPDLEAGRLDELYRGIVAGGLGPQDFGLTSRADTPGDGVGPQGTRSGPAAGLDAFPRLSPGA